MLFVISSSHLTSSPPRQDNAFGKSSIDVHQEISNFHFSKLQWDSDDYSLPLLSDPVHMTAIHIPLIHVFNGNVAEHWCGKLFLPPSHCTNNKDQCKQQLWLLIFVHLGFLRKVVTRLQCQHSLPLLANPDNMTATPIQLIDVFNGNAE